MFVNIVIIFESITSIESRGYFNDEYEPVYNYKRTIHCVWYNSNDLSVISEAPVPTCKLPNHLRRNLIDDYLKITLNIVLSVYEK